MNILPSVIVFNMVVNDIFGMYAVSLIAIDVVVIEKSSPLSNEKYVLPGFAFVSVEVLNFHIAKLPS